MRLIVYLLLFSLWPGKYSVAQNRQKLFHQAGAKGEWQYIYPFKDKSYVLAIQHGEDEDLWKQITGIKDKNTMIYFGRITGKTDQLFWKTSLFARAIKNNYSYEDYNDDGVKDLLIFEDSGARGGNSFYGLYLINPKNHTLTRVKDFDTIVNPSYHQKYKVIVSYAMTGKNYYSLYRIGKNNTVYQVGESFDEREDLDLDEEIRRVLKRK